jgi:potassium-transporting ATPase potassium-binding subunit
MTAGGWLEIGLFLAILTALTPVVGGYLARVFSGEVAFLGFAERPLYRLMGVDPEHGQDWRGYARSVLIFSAGSFLLLYAILRTQGLQPGGPGAPPPNLSFNTAVSFVTNTNWQYYAGETTMTALTQMAGLAVQNFASAAVGIAVVIAVIRGLVARSGRELGVFFVDAARAILYVLLPLSLLLAAFFVTQGVAQSAHLPVASQEAIKLLGTNGGGFFNVNSAFPFENPTWLSNFVQMLAILAIPAGLTATYGRMAGNRRQGWAVFAAMLSLFVVAVAALYAAESATTPAMHAAGLVGPNMEGKEQRFGIASSALYAAVTTAASCGAVNAAMESLSGLGGAVPMAQMMTGEVIFGGVGSGLYGMLLFVLLAVFVAGLMVGRTPELLGKKIEAREIKLTVLATIAVPLVVLFSSAVAIATKHGRASISASGPQGFSETLYAYVSQGNNNGSAFAGYTGFLQPHGTNRGAVGLDLANYLGGAAMLAGRFLPIVLVLAIAGALAGKRVSPAGPGTLRTDTPTFVVMLVAVVLIVALLTFVPALLLGPVVQGLSGRLF